MNYLEKIGNIDSYLMHTSFKLSSYAHSLWFPNPDDWVDPGYWRPAATSLAVIPAFLVSAAATILYIVKFIFQSLAKLALAGAGLCGSTKAREWSQSIDLGLTARRTAVFALGLITYTLAAPCCCVMLGGLFHCLNIKLIKTLGQMEIGGN